MNDTTATLNAELAAIKTMRAQTRQQKEQLLNTYLSLGKVQSQIAKEASSTKIRGQMLATQFPLSQDLNVALRSNCMWLYEALNDPAHEAADILSVLGVSSIHELRSGNPTVIRRIYNKKRKSMT